MTLVGARMTKNQAPQKPSVGRRHSATNVASTTATTTSAYGATSVPSFTQKVPYSKTSGWGQTDSQR